MSSAGVPRVGVGVIIVNDDGTILVGKRRGSHAQFYSIPGGKLDRGETFEACARREVKEETNLDIDDLTVIGVTNNLETFRNEGVHWISVILKTARWRGDLRVMEPAKCEQWLWVDPHRLPEPHFDASRQGVACYINDTFSAHP